MLSVMTVPWDYCGPINHIALLHSDRRDRVGMDSELREESPDVTRYIRGFSLG